MNKTEFVDAVAEKADVQKSDAAKVIDSMVDVIGDALNGGDQVTLIGFGTCLLYTSPSPRDRTRSRMPSSA